MCSVQLIYQQNGRALICLNVSGRRYIYDPNSKPIGEGAMGTVYLGFSQESNERVAIKRIKDRYANNIKIRERAKQEATLSLSHPNLVEMKGLCECAPNEGPMFILSGYIAGITIEAHVKEQLNNLPQSDRLEKIVSEICCVLDALQYLHSNGVVHRDVKPSNIMIENGSVVKLMDLGIARLNGGNKYSSFGFIGTPQYASPEQIARKTEKDEITFRADIYATGVTLYELITGTNPFKTVVDAEVLSRQMTMKLPYNNKLPRTIYNVILKATEKAPEDRYQSATEFKYALMDAYRNRNRKSIVDIIRNPKVILLLVFVMILIFVITSIIYYGHTY